MRMRTVFGCMAVLATTCGAAAAQEKPMKPHWVVQDLYVEDTLQSFDPGKYFVADLAEALKAGGKVDFDYRFDAKSVGGGVEFTTEAVNGKAGKIRADFLRTGKAGPGKVVYDICQRDDGSWLVQDAAVPGKWRLRQLVGLPAPTGC